MKKAIVFIFSVLALSSCATIIHGSKQSININSEPIGAEIYIVNKNGDEKNIGLTPLEAKIPRKTKFIKFKKESYETYTFNSRENADVNWLYWLDVSACFYGNIFPVIIDISTGSYINLQKNVNVELKKNN